MAPQPLLQSLPQNPFACSQEVAPAIVHLAEAARRRVGAEVNATILLHLLATYPPRAAYATVVQPSKAHLLYTRLLLTCCKMFDCL